MENIKEYIKRLWDDKAVLVQEKPITLKSRRESHIYVNHRNFMCIPKNLDLIISMFEEKIKSVISEPYALSNVESSVSPVLVGAISSRVKAPFYFYRPSGSEGGVFNDIFRYDANPSSSFLKNLPAIIIDDVMTTTKTIRMTAQSLNDAGIEVKGAIMLLDRRVKSEKKDNHIQTYPICDLTEVIEYGINSINFEPNIQKILSAELEKLIL